MHQKIGKIGQKKALKKAGSGGGELFFLLRSVNLKLSYKIGNRGKSVSYKIGNRGKSVHSLPPRDPTEPILCGGM